MSYWTKEYEQGEHSIEELKEQIAELVELLEDCKTWIDNTDFINEINEAINKHRPGLPLKQGN